MRDGFSYSAKLRALAKGWRASLEDPRLFFVVSEIAPFAYGKGVSIADFWAAQQRFADEDGDAVCVPINDCGDLGTIHPDRKELPAMRFASIVLNRFYGRKDVPCAIPRAVQADADAGGVIVRFDGVSVLGVNSHPKYMKHTVSGFEVCGDDGIWRKAKAAIDGSAVRIYTKDVPCPKKVRYLHGDESEGEVYSADSNFVPSAFELDVDDSSIDVHLQKKCQEVCDWAVREGLQGALQFCAYRNGKCIVDVWAGTMTTNEGAAKIDGTTLFPIFSTEKPLLATAVHRAVEKGKMAYGKPISTWWPEFRGGGKETLTLANALGYRSGMSHAFPKGIAGVDDQCNWDRICSLAAAEPPVDVPGTVQRYLSMSYAWIIGRPLELAMRKPLNSILMDEVLLPCAIEDDFYFAADDDAIRRTATVYKSKSFESMNDDRRRRMCLPSAFAVSDARAIARFYNRLCGFDGRASLVAAQTLDAALKPCRHADDPVPESIDKEWNMVFGMGYGLWGESSDISRIFGHGGIGGSEGLCDRSQKLTVGFTCNFGKDVRKVRSKLYGIVGMKWRYWDDAEADIQDLQMSVAPSGKGASAEGAAVVYETGFETPEGVKGWNWTNHTMWKVEDGEGVGGGRALVWTNSDPKAQDTCWMEIPGARPGVSYRAEFKIKVHSHSGGTVEGTICWLDGSKWLGGAGGCEVRFDSGKIKPDAEGWMHMAVSTTPYLPAAATSAKMQLYVKRSGVGRIAFDDVRIYAVGERPVGSVNGLVTSRYRATATDGDVKFAVTFEVPREYWNNGRTGAELSYLGVDGLRKTVAMQVPDTFHAETTLPVADFAMGRNPVCATVKGSDGKVFGMRTIEFERVKEMPERRVWIDRFNRTIVEGKPFFPLGMFWSIGTMENVPGSLERYATGPFNCLQNYDHTLGPKELDRFWAKGLRVIVGVKDVFAPVWPNVPCRGKQRRGRPKHGTVLKSWADEDRYLTNLANSLKDHPALLGWYVCDEFPSEMRDRLRDHYELLKRVDPGHPACGSILSHKGDACTFIDCLDVFWVDSYSIAKTPVYGGSEKISEPDYGEAWIAADRVAEAGESCFGMLRAWGVGQAFAHKWDHPERFYPSRELLRFPTFRELKSQCWQIIATGANGIVFYSYSQLLNSPESDEKKDEYFRRTCDVAAEIRRMTPVLTLEPGPKVASKPERVRVRTWRDGDVAYVLVCNTHPERRKGFVSIPGEWKSCTPVFGCGVALTEDGRLELDMPDLASAIVELK